MAEGQVAGRLEIPVVADLAGFAEDLKSKVKKAAAGVQAEIKAVVDGKDLRRELTAAVSEAQRGVKAEIEATINAKRLRRELQAAVAEAQSGVRAEIEATIDGRGLRAELIAAVEAAEAGADEIEVDLALDRKGFMGELRAAIAEGQAYASAHGIDVPIEARGGIRDAILGLFRRARREIDRENGRDPVDIDVQVDGKQKSTGLFQRVLERLRRDSKNSGGVDIDLNPNLGGSGAAGGFLEQLLEGGSNKSIGRLLRPLMLGSLLTMIVPAVDALSSTLTALVSVIGPLAQTSGALGAMPGLIGALVTAMVAGKIAGKGFGEALQAMGEAANTAGKDAKQIAADQAKLEQALGKLSPSARTAAREVFNLGKAFAPVREAVQEALFAKLAGHIEGPLKRALPVLEKGLSGVATALGRSAAGITELIGSKPFLEKLGVVFESNRKIVERLGGASKSFLSALMSVMVASAPFAERVATAVENFAFRLDLLLEKKLKDGSLTKFFEDGFTQAERLWRMTKDLAGGIKGIFSAGQDTGNGLLDDLAVQLDRFDRWANSPKGSKAISDFFKASVPVAKEFLGLIGDVIVGIGKVTGDPKTAEMIRQIREDLLPAIGNFLIHMRDLAPDVIRVISEVVETLGKIADGAIPVFAVYLEKFANAVGWLGEKLAEHPNLAKVLGGVLGAVGGAALMLGTLRTLVRLLGLKGLAGALGSLGGKSVGDGLKNITGLTKLKSGLASLVSVLTGGMLGSTAAQRAESKAEKALGTQVWWKTPMPVTIMGGGALPGGKPGAPVVIPPGGAPSAPKRSLPARVGSRVGGAVTRVGGAITAGGVLAAGAGGLVMLGRALRGGGARSLGALGTGLKAVGSTGARALGGAVRMLGGKGGVAGIIAGFAANPVGRFISGGQQSGGRAIAGGAASGGLKGASIGAMAGSIVPGVGTGIGAAIGGAAGAIMGGLDKAFPDLSSKIKNSAGVLGGIAGGALALAGRKTKPFQWIATKLDDAIPLARTGITKVVGAIGSGLKTAGSAAGSALSTVGKAIGGGLATAGRTALSGAKTAASKIGEGLSKAKDLAGTALTTVGGAITSKLGDAAGAARSKAGEVAGKIGEGLGKAKDFAAEKLGGVVGAAKTKLGEAVGAAKTKASEIAGGVRDKLGAAKDFAATKFGEVTGAAKTKLGETLTAARGKAGEIAGGVRDKLGEAKGFATAKFGEVTSAAKTKLGETLTSARTKAGEIAGGIRDKLGEAKGFATTKFGEVTSAARTKLGETVSTARTKAGETVEAMRLKFNEAKAKANTAFTSVKTEAERISRGLVSGVGTIVGGLKEKFAEPVRWIGSKVLGGLAKVFNKVSGVVKGPRIDENITLGFAKGGAVPGYAPGRDTVHAMLSPGEGILVPEAVRGLAKRMGLPVEKAIQAVNAAFSRRVARPQGAKQKFATGGVVRRGRRKPPGLGLGGVPGLDWLSDKAGDAAGAIGGAAGFAQDLIVNGLQAGFEKLLGPIRALLNHIPGVDTKMGELAKSSMSTGIGALVNWVKGKDDEWGGGEVGGGTWAGGGGWQRIIAALRTTGMPHTVTSTTGGRHAKGSYHYQGRAADIVGPNMRGIFTAIQRLFGSSLRELFFTPMGYSIKNGAKTSPIAAADHYDHVHAALREGATVLPKPGGTLVRLAEAGRAETVVDTGKMNALIARLLDGGGLEGRGVVFEQGSIVVHNPEPEPASQSVHSRLRHVAAFGIFG